MPTPLKFRLLAGALLVCVAAAGAQAQSDSTLDTAQRLMRRSYLAARDAPLGQNAEAGQVIAALRSSGDKELLPFFTALKASKSIDNQIFGMVAAAILSKQAGLDPEKPEFKPIDMKLLFSSKDSALIGSSIASLIDSRAISVAQLREMMASAPDSSHRAMAAGELSRVKQLTDRTALQELLRNDKEVVRYYSAITMLTGSADEQKAAFDTMKTMTAAHDLRQAPIQALMLVRMQKEDIATGVPWAALVAADEQCDEGLRYTALATLLSFKSPQGPEILAGMIQKQKDSIQQVKLGLISLEHASQIKPEILAPLLESRSTLARTIAQIAQKRASGVIEAAPLQALIKEGHPIILDWALAFSDRSEPGQRLVLRSTIVNQATIVDNVRSIDFERAALAAQKILTDDGEEGRKVVAGFLKSENRAVVEATLAGIFRSDGRNLSELVMTVWEGLNKTTSMENATNYAALILAREGRREALVWLPSIMLGGTAQGPGIRALAGWYYAKLNNRVEPLLAAVLAD